MATLSLDGPGPGRDRLQCTSGPTTRWRSRRSSMPSQAVTSSTRPDRRRRGQPRRLLRRSRGRLRAPLRALAGVSGPYDFAAGWDTMPELTRETIDHHTGADGAEVRPARRARELEPRRRGRAGAAAVPGGDRRADRVISLGADQADRRRRPRREWVLYEDGTHVCNNIPYKYRPLVADWLRARLGRRRDGADRASLPRREDARVLRGETRYLDDIEPCRAWRTPPSSAALRPCGDRRRSPCPPAAEGLIAVITAADIGDAVRPFPVMEPRGGEVARAEAHPVLAARRGPLRRPARGAGDRAVSRAGRGRRRAGGGGVRPGRSSARRAPRTSP